MKILFFKYKSPQVYKALKVLSIGLFLFLGIAVIYIYSILSYPVALKEGNNVTLNIPQNSNADKIANILYEKGVIKNSWVFSIYTRYTGVDGQLKPGKYNLQNGQTLPGIVQQMIKGPPNILTITIPEGYTVRQVSDLLVNEGFVTNERFYNLVAEGNFQYSFVSGLVSGNRRLEGYLFPDTYHVSKNSEDKVIIDMMLNRFNNIIKDLDFEIKAQRMGLTLHEGVTIASMIEREAKFDKERPLIAGVIYNRLELGMPLQIDATVQYALGTNRSKLYYKDLETDSPYNTYQINGLPPGPIASPGKASLLAVINPKKSEYLYYVAKPDGTHAFSKTLAEHNKNKAKYLR